MSLPGEEAPVVTVNTMTRYHLNCAVCNLTPMFWSGGYATVLEAEQAASKYREAHAAQPFCTCGTYPGLSWDDEGDPEVGHAHCRCRGRCCHYGCLTRILPPAGGTAS